MATAPPSRLRWLQPRRTLIVIALIAVILLAVVALSGMFKPKEDAGDTLQTVVVKRADIERNVAATGKVVPNFEVEIKGKASGKIIQLPFDVSDYVRQGDLLVQLDPIDESRQVSQASASLAGVESRMDQTRLNLQVARQNLATDISRARADLRAAEARARDAESKRSRLEELVRNRYISQEEYETGTTTAAQAESELENAKVRLRELQTQEVALKAQEKDLSIASAEAQAQRVALATSQQRLDETRIYAPISGIVTTRTGQIGQIVASGISNVGGGTSIMTIADLSRIFVLASVDESDIGLVREGQPVHITADAYPGQVFEGRVVQISPKGIEESNVVTFEVKIEVAGANKQLLRPQMTANVEIKIEQKRNVLTAPAEAITSANGKTAVKILGRESKPVLRPVQVGINNGTEAEIVRGLKPGDKVVISEQKDAQSRWRKDQRGGGNGNMRGQRMMMRSLGGGGGRR